jgi:hypothetical protein
MNGITKEAQSAMQVAPVSADLPMVATSSAALILDSASMDSMMRLADIMAKGRSTIPEHLRGNAADCAAVVMQAVQWRMNPFAVAQKTHLVNGTLGYEAQLVNAVIQSSGVAQDRFAYEWYGPWEKIIGKTKVITMPAKGDKKEYQFRVPDYGMQDENGLGVRVSCTLKGEMAPRVLDLLLVQASVRNSPLWATDPKQQLAYLAVKRWTRLYAPDVILGVYTPDELEEVNREMRDITPAAERVTSSPAAPEASMELIQQAKAAASRGVAAYQKFWSEAGAPSRKALAAHHEGWKAEATAADQGRTIDAEPASSSAKPLSDDMQAILADFSALADEGLDLFNDAWGRLSPATQDGLAEHYPALKARAEAAGAAQ